MRARTLLLVALAAVVPVTSHAITVQVPYSGQLSENGQLVDGSRTLQFNLYPVPAGGTLLATQTETLTLVRGVYHTLLTFDDSVWSLSEQRWIGVSVDAGPELPRVAIGFVPFAVRALNTETPPPGVNFLSSAGSTQAVTTSSSWTRLDTVGVTAPGDGYLWLSTVVRVNPVATQNPFHDISVVMSETTPPASPTDRLWVREALSGPGNWRSYSHTQVLPVTAGHHAMGLYVRQIENLGGGVTTTNFTRVTLQAMWVPRLYP